MIHDKTDLKRLKINFQKQMQVDVNVLNQQVAERQRKAEAAQTACQTEEANFMRWVITADVMHMQAEQARKMKAKHLAQLQKCQVEEKKLRDEKLLKIFTNKIEESYFKQFGTSHR